MIEIGDFKDARILVTGGTGSLGKALLQRAQQENWGAEFVILSRDETKQSEVRNKYPEYTYLLGDVAKFRDVQRAMVGVDFIFHFAAYKQVPSAQNNVASTVATNVLGSQNIVDAAIQANVISAVASSTDKACLDWHSRVLLPDGTSRPIGELVRDKYSGEVVTIDPFTQERKTTKVIGWYKNKLAGRTRYKISYLHSRPFSRAIVTEDHLLLTTDGWKQAGEITEKTMLITEEPAANEKQMSLLIGTLLGDASLCKPASSNARSHLCLVHAKKEQEWLRIKRDALRGFSFSNEKWLRQKKHPQIRVDSAVGAFFTELRHAFYPQGKKIVPRGLVEQHFSPQLLAAWFMDDGVISQNNGGRSAPSARLATHGFTPEDAEWLAGFLTFRGLTSYILMVTVSNKCYPELRFTTEGTQALFEYIRPGIPSSMAKKIDYVDYNPAFWELGTAVRHVAPARKWLFKAPKRDVYCLDVEQTHTFVSQGVVVHNCQAVNYYGASKFLMEGIFQNGNRHDITTFHLTRYGNVLSSNQSVVPYWKKQLARGQPITVTDRRMTRFWLTLDQAIDLLLLALSAPPGVIVVPKAPAMSVYELAKAVAGEHPIVETEIRPGEKLTEMMVSEAESFHTQETEEHFFIHPSTSEYRNLSAPFSYTSDNPAKVLSAEEILTMLAETEKKWA